MSSPEIAASVAGAVSDADQAALAALLAGPQVGVHVRIAVKFRAMQMDIAAVTLIDHSWEWPIPAVFARANPNPVALNTHGIEMSISLTEPGVGRAAAPRQPAVAAPTPLLPQEAPALPPPSGGDVLQEIVV